MAKPDISILTAAEAAEIVRGIVMSPELRDMPYRSEADVANVCRRVRELLTDAGFNGESAAITVSGNTLTGKVEKVWVRIAGPRGGIIYTC